MLKTAPSHEPQDVCMPMHAQVLRVGASDTELLLVILELVPGLSGTSGL